MMTAEAIADAWNSAVALRRPTLGELEQAVRAAERTPLFPVPSGKFLLGKNLIAVTAPGSPGEPTVPVLAVQLVWRAGYYGGPNASRFVQLPGFRLLGCAFPCSAQQLLGHFKTFQRRASLELETSHKGWDLFHGRALGFHFRPVSGAAVDPALSELCTFDFNYILPYGGPLPPLLASRG